MDNRYNCHNRRKYSLKVHVVLVMKIHLPNCPSVNKIAEYNRQNYTGDIKDLLSQGYSPCGYCHPN